MRKLVFSALTCTAALLLGGCPSGSDNPPIEIELPQYRLSTFYQGPTHPLSIFTESNGGLTVRLAESIGTSNSQLWTFVPQGDGLYRIQNVSTGIDSSLAIREAVVTTPIEMIGTAEQSAQLWQVTPLENGFCRVTSQLLGQSASLDIINEDNPRRIKMAFSEDVQGQFWQLTTDSSGTEDTTLARCKGDTQAAASSTVPALEPVLDATTNNYTPTSRYRSVIMRDVKLLVSPELDADPQQTNITLTEIEAQLAAIEGVLPAEALIKLRENIDIWIELNAREAGAAEYHNASEEGLRLSGLNPQKSKDIEISNARNFVSFSQLNQPWMVLHELAHAWHFAHPEYHAEILAAYEAAKSSGIYESVRYSTDELVSAYALENEYEYFSELTEAYFGLNDFYPFVREELRQFDSPGFAVIEKAWGIATVN